MIEKLAWHCRETARGSTWSNRALKVHSEQENQLEWEGNHENTRNDVLHKLKTF